MRKRYVARAALASLAVVMTGALAPAAMAASVGSQAEALMPAAKQIADPFRRGAAEAWLEVAQRQDSHVFLASSVYNNAATRALGNGRNLIDGGGSYTPIYASKQWPTRPDWVQAIREVEAANQRVAAAAPACRTEASGRLLVLTDEIWKEQEETHGTRWVHGWEAIERAQKLSAQVNDQLARCVPPVAAVTAPVAAPIQEKPVSLAADTLFDFDSAKLKPEGVDAVSQLAQSMQSTDSIEVVTVIGYTDRFGSVAHNRDLSRRRAQAVADVLKARGVNAERFDVRGAGSTAPVATCPGRKSAAVIACLAPNRRVEVRVSGTTKRAAASHAPQAPQVSQR